MEVADSMELLEILSMFFLLAFVCCRSVVDLGACLESRCYLG